MKTRNAPEALSTNHLALNPPGLNSTLTLPSRYEVCSAKITSIHLLRIQ